ncbi:folate-binding protein YgfZ [Granulicella sp. WH15]|nr:folate-binding protein YgfZ [Granulicella sp. WH15]
MIPNPNPESSLKGLLTRAAVARLDSPGWLRVTGADRVRWLNGMVTNSIQALAPGQGCYNFFLNAQGRIQADATAFLLEDSILLETDRHRVGALVVLLDHFIIMDDVELAPIGQPGDPTGERHGILIAGPNSASVLAHLGLPVETLGSLERRLATWQDSPIELIHAHSPLVPRYELWLNSETGAASLTAALLATGACKASSADVEQLRILEGTPLYGTDIRDKELPQETDQTRALHFAKGCYLGQEIVERIRSRGNVHRTFSGFKLTGELPPAGAALTSEEKPVGELTSVARINLPSGPIQLALGYIRREALDRATPIQYPGGTATPMQLPFPI